MSTNEINLNDAPINETYKNSKTILGGIRFNSRVGLFLFISFLALLLMAGLMIKGKRNLETTIKSLKTDYEIVSLISRLETSILAVVGSSKNFILNKNVEKANSHNMRSSRAAQQLVKLQDLPGTSDGQKMISALIEDVTQHATHVQNIYGFREEYTTNQNTNLMIKVATSGSRLQKIISMSRNEKLLKQSNSTRAFERSLLATSNIDEAQQILRAITNLRQTVIAATMPNSTKTQIIKSINAYIIDVEKLVQQHILVLNEIALLDEVNIRLENSLISLKDFSQTVDSKVSSKAILQQDQLQAQMGWGSLAIIGLLSLFGLILIYSVTSPVKALAKSALGLANGNNLINIPALDNQDETGDLAVALRCFKENMLQADTLREELETLLIYQQESKLNQVPSGGDSKEDEIKAFDLQMKPTASENVTSQNFLSTHYPNSKTIVPTKEYASKNTATEGSNEELKITPISQMSQLVADTSKSASNAAKYAEKGDTLVGGLNNSIKKIGDIESLLISISDHMALLAVQTSITKETVANESELNTSEAPVASNNPKQQNKVEGFVSDNINSLQSNTKRAIKALHQVGETINSLNQVAVEVASDASEEALTAATELLKQSQTLRGMLDNMIVNIKLEPKN